MFRRPEVIFGILLVLLCLGTSASAQEEVRQVEHNRIVLDLPTFNFTRLYNDINLRQLYNRLFNSTREKEKETVPVVNPEDPVDLQPTVVTQTLASPILQNGYQYVPQSINGLYPGLVPVSVGTQRSGSSSLSGLIGNPALSNLISSQLLGRQAGYGYQHGRNYLGGNRYVNSYTGGYGYVPGIGYPGSPGNGYPGLPVMYGLQSLNSVPGFSVKEVPWSELNREYYNLYYDYDRHGHHHHHGHHSPHGHSHAHYDQFRPGHFGGGNRFGLRSGSADINSFGDSYSSDEGDESYDDDEDSYDEGDDFEDGDGQWRKAETETETKPKQRKMNKRVKKLKEQLQQQQQQQRSKRISY